jgi:radical SAM family uncharacterized protein
VNRLRFIDPLKDLGHELFDIQKPARYLGGELGSHTPITEADNRYKFALCFPDLYEIGMSNNAIRIIYNDVARFCNDEVICERVFAPAQDFEKLLAAQRLPLYTLESGIPLKDCDMLGFSIGYELLATNMLTIIELGQIPLSVKDRGNGDPLVIAGGPASTNPHPFGAFLDAVYIGESEAGFYTLLNDLAGIKKNGADRANLLERLIGCENMWISPFHLRFSNSPKRQRKTLRAVFPDFSLSGAETYYPLPVLQPVQNHGSVEIMRGCPNGCRFCHAGYYYKPQRIKSPEIIKKEVQELVEKAGHREITLASLSSGDYPDIVKLFTQLNSEWNYRSVSFQLPSLKVDSFTLPLLAEVSQLRKSGLTFAVETPINSWQRSVNKVVSYDKIVAIINEAKRYGFRSAKFYFMIGLPLPERGRGEGEAIIDFLSRLMSEAPIAMNVNIGTFVPKPHTAYERVEQIGEDEALKVIYMIKDRLKPFRSISISYHSPFSSVLEGIISRGDKDVGELLIEAHHRGARFEAWDDQVNKALWRQLFEDMKIQKGKDLIADTLSERNSEASLPWDDINLFISKSFLKEEMTKSEASVLTSACVDEDCDHPCGSCNDRFRIVQKLIHADAESEAGSLKPGTDTSGRPSGGTSVGANQKIFSWSYHLSSDAVDLDTSSDRRLVISFKKIKAGTLYPLHSISGIFMRASTMLDLPVRHSVGFNPLPKMELNQPLSLGIASNDEIVAFWLKKELTENECTELLNELKTRLPTGLQLNRLRQGKKRSEGKNSIGSIYKGSIYSISFFDENDKSCFINHLNSLAIEYNDSQASEVSLYLADSHGAEQNVGRLISTALNEEKLLSRCSITRECCFAEYKPQKDTILTLFDAL